MKLLYMLITGIFYTYFISSTYRLVNRGNDYSNCYDYESDEEEKNCNDNKKIYYSILNNIYIILGIGIILFGILLHNKYKNYENIISSLFVSGFVSALWGIFEKWSSFTYIIKWFVSLITFCSLVIFSYKYPLMLNI